MQLLWVSWCLESARAAAAYSEDAVKAAYLYRFAGYVEWPEESSTGQPFHHRDLRRTRDRAATAPSLAGTVSGVLVMFVDVTNIVRAEYPTTPTTLEADPVRITRVLSNLLMNAAKYTPRGGLVEMGTRFGAQGLVIFVRDNGAGLAAETIPGIFAMFTQAESELSRSEGGRCAAHVR